MVTELHVNTYSHTIQGNSNHVAWENTGKAFQERNEHLILVRKQFKNVLAISLHFILVRLKMKNEVPERCNPPCISGMLITYISCSVTHLWRSDQQINDHLLDTRIILDMYQLSKVIFHRCITDKANQLLLSMPWASVSDKNIKATVLNADQVPYEWTGHKVSGASS